MKTEQRQLALAGLLRGTRKPLTRREIVDALAPIGGYTGNDEANRKKLRRDLERLRELGLVVRYLTHDNAYLLDATSRSVRPLELEETEASLLREAVALLNTPSLGPFAVNLSGTLERLELSAFTRDTAPVVVHQPERDTARVTREVERLCLAAWRRRPVTFHYQRPLSSDAQQRCVEPWGLFSRSGRWYLVGWCRLREARRCFLVSRMSEIDIPGLSTAGPAFDPPEDVDLAADATRAVWDWNVHPATLLELRVDGIGPIVARRLGGTLHGDIVRADVTHIFGVWDLLVEWCPRVVPLAPSSLVDAWTDHVQRIAQRHRP